MRFSGLKRPYRPWFLAGCALARVGGRRVPKQTLQPEAIPGRGKRVGFVLRILGVDAAVTQPIRFFAACEDFLAGASLAQEREEATAKTRRREGRREGIRASFTLVWRVLDEPRPLGSGSTDSLTLAARLQRYTIVTNALDHLDFVFFASVFGAASKAACLAGESPVAGIGCCPRSHI